MNGSLEQTQHHILKRRVDDVIYYAETAEQFLQCLDEADGLMTDYLMQLPEDVVVSYLQKLSNAAANIEYANKAYQLVRAAYLSVNPDSIVGEM